MASLDRLDAKLIGHLGEDPRISVHDLATALGVARNTVQSRLRRLKDNGTLKGFRPELDLPSIGISIQAFMGLELEQGRLQAVLTVLRKLPEVLEIHATTGREDLLVRVAATTQANLQATIERIVSVEGVTHSTTTLALTSPLEYRIQPMLHLLTRDSGHGRAQTR